MNPIQKQLLVYGAAAMLAMVAFPPWTRITQHVTPALDKSAVQTETQESAGYSWLFEPPKTASQPGWGFGNYESVRIDFGRLVVQWLAAAFLTGAGLLYFKDSDKKSLAEWWSSVITPAKPVPPSIPPKAMPPDSPNSGAQVPTDVGSNKASETTSQNQLSPWKRALKPAEAAFGIGVVAGIASATSVHMDVPPSNKLLFDGFMGVFAGLLLAVPTYLIAGFSFVTKGVSKSANETGSASANVASEQKRSLGGGTRISTTVPVVGSVPSEVCRYANWSLGLGIVGIFPAFGLLTAIPAIICGHKALRKIAASGGAISGRTRAIAGLTLAYIVLPFSVIFILILLLQ